MCAGCGAPTVVRQVLMGTSDPVVVEFRHQLCGGESGPYAYTS